MTKKQLTQIADVLRRFKQPENDKYISAEFQKYGYDLASELGEVAKKALYIKLAKSTPRGYLESARNFVKDANNVKSKGKLFLWKLKQLKEENKKRITN